MVRAISAEEAMGRSADLTEILRDCVDGGASVSFMTPLAPDKAEAFWRAAAEGIARGERILLVAEEQGSGELVGTVMVVFAQPENQPHRADISKMLVHRRARKMGVGAALMRAAEAAARAAGKTVLVLDTASPEAERLYERAGWIRVGVVPDFALMPDGRLCDTIFFYKHLR
ncbi:MAG: GNAT family N-acetyltransferase [Acidisphaera sp.]|nr:GNAT family N-acetyltransferase [Acidisphaera sp.]